MKIKSRCDLLRILQIVPILEIMKSSSFSYGRCLGFEHVNHAVCFSDIVSSQHQLKNRPNASLSRIKTNDLEKTLIIKCIWRLIRSSSSDETK